MRNLRFQLPVLQFSALMGIFLVCIVISSLVVSSIVAGLPQLNDLSPEAATPQIIGKFKIAQLVSALSTFVLPALLFFYFRGTSIQEQTGLAQPVRGEYALLIVLLLLAAAPAISLIGSWNEQIKWGSLQEMVDGMDRAHTNIMTIMLRMDGPADLIINLLLMAVLPAVAEELFFRAALQPTMHRWWQSPALAVFGSSLFFAIMHGTFSKIIPIFLMGVVLGALYMLTKNLWYCILLHFLFNGIQVVLLYFSKTSEIVGFDPSSQEFQFPVWAGVTGGLAVIGIFIYLNRAVQSWR